MSELVLWNWEKKKRTLLRYIEAGDIFCFQYNTSIYCFGRILARLDIGTPAEIFDYISNAPTITEKDIEKTARMFHPVNLDVYTLFDRRLMGDWRIIGKCRSFQLESVENAFFTYGVAPYRKIDISGNKFIITKEEAKNLQSFGFFNDIHIKKLIKAKINKDYDN